MRKQRFTCGLPCLDYLYLIYMYYTYVFHLIYYGSVWISLFVSWISSKMDVDGAALYFLWVWINKILVYKYTLSLPNGEKKEIPSGRFNAIFN